MMSTETSRLMGGVMEVIADDLALKAEILTGILDGTIMTIADLPTAAKRVVLANADYLSMTEDQIRLVSR